MSGAALRAAAPRRLLTLPPPPAAPGRCLATAASAAPRRLLVLPPPAAPSRCLPTAASTAPAEAPPSPPSQEWLAARPFSEIPGPRKVALLASLFFSKFGKKANKDPVEANQMVRDLYGDIVKIEGIPGRAPMVLLFNADDIEKAFRNEGQFPVRAGNDALMYYRRHVRPEWFRGSHGLVGTQGEDWYDFRRRVNQVLMQPRSAKLYLRPIDQVAQDFVNRMAQLKDENQQMPDDFLNELCKWSLESVSLVALDARLGCLQPNLPPDSEPQRMIDSVKVVFDAMLKLEFRLSPWKLITTPTWRRYVKALDFFYTISMRHLNAAMERIKAKSENVAGGELSVLERLLLQNDDPRVACVMALDMMFAGVDTTSNAAAACLYYLSKNPEAQQRLFHEVYSQLPESPSQPLTAGKLEQCRYLKACFREAMRLKPIAPGNLRRCQVDNLVLSGYRIPKGVDLAMGHAQLSVSELYFPQADQFRPERWLKGPDGRSEAQGAHPFASMPFGFGPRTCIGRRFAELEVYTLVARIIRRFRVELDGDVSWKSALIYTPSSPLKFKVIDREH